LKAAEASYLGRALGAYQQMEAAVVASRCLEVLEALALEHQSVGAAYLKVAVAVDLQ